MRQFCSSTVILVLSIFLVSDAVAKNPPWQVKHQQLQSVRDNIFSELEEIHSVLSLRAQDIDPALKQRLSMESVDPRVSGYGLLPVIEDNEPFGAVTPRQTVYSLERLEARFHEELENTETLSVQIVQNPDLESLVSRFENLLEELRHLENHLSYQEQWQRSVAEYPEYFRGRNKLIAQIREIEQLSNGGGSDERRAGLRDQLIQDVVSFKPTPGVTLISHENGERVLPVTVCTDIEDSGFLQVFEQGVDEAFNQSVAARERRFSVRLNWHFMAAETLYPEGTPADGARIDADVHRALFGNCRMILTTGASSTYARVGDRVVLGTDPLSRRTLAHEFAHLLGFSDTYLRGFDGEQGDPYGVVLIEWSGLTDDLMSNPDGGKVSATMVETLLTAY